MSKLKILSGEDVIKIFFTFGFKMASQRGSHLKLKRTTPNGVKQTLTIPNHKELDRGTISAIYHQALRYLPEQDLQPHFCSE